MEVLDGRAGVADYFAGNFDSVGFCYGLISGPQVYRPARSGDQAMVLDFPKLPLRIWAADPILNLRLDHYNRDAS